MIPLLLCALASTAARADDDDTDRLARDRVLHSVKSGKALPLTTLKAIVLKRWPGELLEVSIEEEDGALAYAFKVLTDGGRLTEIEIDARTGNVIEVENE